MAIGNSHLNALRMAVKAETAEEQFGFHVDYLSTFDPQYQPFWSRDGGECIPHAQFETDAAALMNDVKADLVVAFVSGVFQFTYGTYEDARPFDFFLPQAPDLGVLHGREIIPYDLILETARGANQLWPPLLRRIIAWAGPAPVISIGPPPPIADFTPFYAEVKEKADERGFQPDSARAKLWRVQVFTEREHAAALGAQFLDSPREAVMEPGLLRAEYAADPVHANVRFGRLLAHEIQGVLTRRRETEEK